MREAIEDSGESMGSAIRKISVQIRATSSGCPSQANALRPRSPIFLISRIAKAIPSFTSILPVLPVVIVMRQFVWRLAYKEYLISDGCCHCD